MFNLIIALITIPIFVIILFSLPGMSDFWHQSMQNKFKVIGLISFVFLFVLWKYSKPYWKLRDKIAGPNGKNGPKIALIAILAGLIAGIISLFYSK